MVSISTKNWYILMASYLKCGHHYTQKILLEIINKNNKGIYTHDLYKQNDMWLNTCPYIDYYIFLNVLERFKMAL